MTNQRPTVPLPEQVDQWFDDAMRLNSTPKYYIARQAALWSADHELEECCEELNSRGYPQIVGRIRAARRPKLLSLKEQALAELDDAVMRGDCITISDALPTLRRALEALSND
jgi:hypothetical protein